jgi:hypothetical protein
LKEIVVVEKEHLIKYLMDCQEDSWTIDGWNKLFKKLRTVLTCDDYIPENKA